MKREYEVSLKALALHRRIKACQFLRLVPTEKFDMVLFESITTKCPLGWLASKQFDDWSWNHDKVPVRNYQESFYAASAYFGMTRNWALKVFFPITKPVLKMFGKPTIHGISVADFEKTLMKVPYNLKAMYQEEKSLEWEKEEF